MAIESSDKPNRREFLTSAALVGSGSARRLCDERKRMTTRSDATPILWQQLDGTGIEHCALSESAERIACAGVVVMSADDVPYRIEYEVTCDRDWYTRTASIRAHTGSKVVDISVRADEGGRWWVNGQARDDLKGCTDIDLGFSPSTNTLPIRRLGLSVGQQASIEAAWVRFPDLGVQRVAQRYLRVGDFMYRYENLPTGFQAEVLVDARGLVVRYPPGWERIDDQAANQPQSILFSPDRTPTIGTGDDLYGWLVGSWELDVIDHEPGGGRRTGKGEVHFAWVLEGRAMQDVWITPQRAERRPDQTALVRNRYGTTLRVYDPTRRNWRITWINPVNGAHNSLVGERRGDEIVQEGTDDDGSLMRWRFTKIRPDSFHWIGDVSADGGKTWATGAEFLARRTSARPLH